jgi:hypothetical protein
LGASVIELAGEDPRRYDDEGGMPAGVTGYHLGGFGRRSEIPQFDYERWSTDEKGDVIVRTQYDDIEQNEVLWIPPETCHLPGLPDGFALRVDEFLGRDYDGPGRRVWVRGPVLLNARGPALRTLTLCVPVDQPRAVLTNRAPHPAASAQDARVEQTRAVGDISTTAANAAGPESRDAVEYAGCRYRRVF